MFYQYTGQPGHGKTVLAIEFALDMKAKADKLHAEDPTKHPFRELYVVNVRDFNHGAAGAVECTAKELLAWCDHPDYLAKLAELDALGLTKESLELAIAAPAVQKLASEMINPAFENAIVLVDEAYEHGMFPRRPPGRPIPRHVERIAKHRHFGIDFIMVCQSPKKQMDDFLHDLIEEHYHIRRRYGLPFVHVKRWDSFEANPTKAPSLTTTRRRYPTKIFKLYTSTKYDTSEKRVPWFYWALGGLVVLALGTGGYAYKRVNSKLSGKATVQGAEAQLAHGAPATGATPVKATPVKSRGNLTEYLEAFTARVPTQPWSAPAYDGLSVPADPPRIFCMSAGAGIDAQGKYREASCSCKTDQGTRFMAALELCSTVSLDGQYEPFLKAQSHEVERDLVKQNRSSAGPAPVAVVVDRGFNGAQTMPESPGYQPGASGPSAAP